VLWGRVVDPEGNSLDLVPDKIETGAIWGPKLALEVRESRENIIGDVRFGSPNAQAETKKIFGAEGRNEATDAVMAVGRAPEFR
jgi:hypothetical protein